MQTPSAHITSLPPITIVGHGRMGNALRRALEGAGHQVGMVGRDTAEKCRGAEVVVLCVPDSEIGFACEQVASVSRSLRFIGHTSGATGLDALTAAAERGAQVFSIHPLQTIPDVAGDLTGAPAAVAGATPRALKFARELAQACQMAPFEVPEDSRAAYHAAAAMASNFLIALEASAEELLTAAGIENGRELLTPLVLRTAANWAEHGSGALTGPIARGDERTVQRHLRAIEEVAPELAETYRALAERTRVTASAGDHR